MDKSPSKSRQKVKPKKGAAKSKTPKKNQKKEFKEGPTCSMFLANLTRKLKEKMRHEEDVEMTKDIVQEIIDNISSALPVRVLKKVVEEIKQEPVGIEHLQAMAPELMPREPVDIEAIEDMESIAELAVQEQNDSSPPSLGEILRPGIRMPKMPLVTSEIMKPKFRPTVLSMHDIAINTGGDQDVASEIKKHVGTLKKISLIAEEFNQKTAKSLKEIVDSVQEDLIKKLEEIQKSQKAEAAAAAAEGDTFLEDSIEGD